MNKLPIKKWPRMVAKLKGRFLPKDYQVELYRQVQNLRQKGMTIKEYTEEFYHVNLRDGYTDDTPEKTTRYVNSLRLEILDEISILSPWNIEEAFQSVVKAKEKINRKQNNRRGRGNGRGRGQSYGRGRTARNSEEDSSSRASGTTKKGDSMRGEQDGQRGTFFAQPEEAEALPQEVENVEEIGEALVLNKVLLKLAKETIEQTQRKALFWIVCKSHGKCCKLIIDSGSIDNLVATEMVEKLGLRRLKHPTPYKDKVVCDIMLMDVCHILLGRPWQYDRKVVHDGKMDCYKFVKDGVKHTLVPTKEEDTAEASGTKALLVGGKQFIKWIEENKVNYAVVRRTKTVLLHTEMPKFPVEI
eukprot:PITA_21135